jgi:hypothetical protein
MAQLSTPLTRLRAGHEAAAARQRALDRSVGPEPAQAVAEANAALEALVRMGGMPTTRDPVSERGVEEVRARWVLLRRRAQRSAAERGEAPTD